MSELRYWQKQAIDRAMTCYRQGKRHFAVDAAPGTGKTLYAIHLAKRLLDESMIDRVIVIAPRNEIVRQWAKDFEKVTGSQMMKLTKGESRALDVEDITKHIASTWAGIRGIADAVQVICESYRVLVVADEVHHAALEAAWGTSAMGGMQSAKHVLALSGTPVRSDGQESIWLDDAIKADDYYTVPYKVAVQNKWCVPVTFHRHHGEFNVSLDGQSAVVSTSGVQLPEGMPKAVTAALERSLRFEKLVKVPMRDPMGKPRLDSYHSTMLDWASLKLEELRAKPEGEFGKPDAAALVIAPSIEMAEYFAELITLKWPQEKPVIVHSGSEAAALKIQSFRTNDKKWIVSVNMISEGVDIHRLRVLVFLPMASTELYFRQAIGRVIRKKGDWEKDNSRAYVVMPELQNFVEYAGLIEEEMQEAEKDSEDKTERKPREPGEAKFWSCGEETHDGCGAINSMTSKVCHACGASRTPTYETTLEEAQGWREGVITRGEELPEESVAKSEEISSDLQRHVIKTGSPRMMRIMQLIPEEMYAEVEELFVEVRAAKKAKAAS